MRILFITQWFAPEPHFKGLPLALEFQRRGHQVCVLTGFPNYPGGKLYPGYRLRLWQKEEIDGVLVVRVPLHPSHDKSAVGRVLNYASFALAAAILGPILVPAVDVAYVYHPPPTVGLPALAFRWLRGVKCVYDVQDLWPDTLAATGMVRSRALLRMAGLWSNFIYRHMDHVVVLSPGFRTALVERGVAGEVVETIYNWSPDEHAPATAATLPPEEVRQLEGRFNIVFAGNLGPAQGLFSVLEAAKQLGQTCPLVQIVFVGDGIDAAALRAAAGSSPNVIFLPRRPPAAMAAVYSVADALLVHLRDDPLFAITIPSKTQTYLAAGRPIIAALRGDAARLIQESGAGLVCPPESPAELADAIVRITAMSRADIKAMGQRGRDFYGERLAFAKGATLLLGALESQMAKSQTL